MSVINSQPLIGASGNQGGAYNIERSLRLRKSATAFLSRTPSTAGNRQKWTWSGWVKRGALDGAIQNVFNNNTTPIDGFSFEANNTLKYRSFDGASEVINMITTQVFRDVSAWYHIVIAMDTTQATSSNRFKLYVNGVQVTSFSTATYPALNYNTGINTTTVHQIGAYASSGTLDGYIAELNFVDGQALTPSSFGETDTITGVWKPKAYTGTYGTNGFYLKFNNLTSTSTLGNDSSGNSNTWTVNNVSLTAGTTYDSMTDVPTLTSATAANYAVLNPLKSYYAPTNGNLTVSTGASVTGLSVASIGLGTGNKYYFEATATGTAQQIGIFSDNHALTPTGSKRYWYLESGGLYNDGTQVQTVATFTSGDTIGLAWDGAAQTITFYKNNTQQGTAISVDTAYSYFFGVGVYNGGWNVNFGQRLFAYTPPSGFVALNTFNLPDSTIVAGNKVMDATLYTGTGATRSITNSGGFQPDLVWVKNRTDALTDHKWTDAVRGVTKSLESNTTDAEATDTNGLTAFNTNGFALGSDSSYNANTKSFVGWQWKGANGTVSNTAGTITSTVSANTSAGFSVVKFTCITGASSRTVGHGLGVAPSMYILKCTTAGSDWDTYHVSLGATKSIQLNLTNAAGTTSTAWNNTAPTSTVFTIGSQFVPDTNSYVAYCWSEIAGFSKFGSYTGNGSTDGVFVYTGFRPKFILVKRSSSANTYWNMYDSSRSAFNVTDDVLYANLSDAEAANEPTLAFDMLSNGFKARTTGSSINQSGETYIYAAFAENPFKNSLAR